MTIKFNNRDYEMKQSIRSLILFEELTNKKAAEMQDNLTDMLTLFFCMLKANNKDFTLNFSDFIDILDSEPLALESFTNYINFLAKEAQAVNPNKKKAKGKQ